MTGPPLEKLILDIPPGGFLVEGESIVGEGYMGTGVACIRNCSGDMAAFTLAWSLVLVMTFPC